MSNEQPKDSAKETAKETGKEEDLISLDDFILNTEKVDESSKVTQESAAVGNKPNQLGAVDQALAEEDPSFGDSMKTLKTAGVGAGTDVEIDSIDVDKVISEQKKLKSRIKFLARTLILTPLGIFINFLSGGEPPLVRITKLGKAAFAFIKSAGIKIFGFITSLLKIINNYVGAYFDMSFPRKMLVVTVVLLGAATYFVIQLTLSGRIKPSVSETFASSMTNVADEKFSYSSDEPTYDFNDPVLHPEHIVLFDKFVVNLKPTDSSPNPMGLFEFFLEASTSEGAVELKDREVEVRDSISRALEQMTYDELTTVIGKNKVKIIMRKNLNDILTKGRIRRVFYNNVVLKP